MRRFNWQIWLGFLLTVFAFLSYPFIFINWDVTRDFPWANIPMFVIAAVLLFFGIRKAFGPGRRLISKIVAPVLAVLSTLIVALFVFVAFIEPRWLPASTRAPQVGQKAPEFNLTDTNNKTVALTELLTQPVANQRPKGVLLIFYRGYWWIICNSELRSIEKNLSTFYAAGIRPVAISVDTPAESRDLAQKAGYTFTLLSDDKRDAITFYDLVHKGGGPSGQDISRPAEFLLDSSGTVRWRMLTENYWVRARPQQILEAAKALQ